MKETKGYLKALVRQVDVLNKVAVATVKRHLRALVVVRTIVTFEQNGGDLDITVATEADRERYFDPEFDALDSRGDGLEMESRRAAMLEILGPKAGVREDAFYRLLRRYYRWSPERGALRLVPLTTCGTSMRRSHGRNRKESA